jgi:hypothetical protein
LSRETTPKDKRPLAISSRLEVGGSEPSRDDGAPTLPRIAAAAPVGVVPLAIKASLPIEPHGIVQPGPVENEDVDVDFSSVPPLPRGGVDTPAAAPVTAPLDFSAAVPSAALLSKSPTDPYAPRPERRARTALAVAASVLCLLGALGGFKISQRQTVSEETDHVTPARGASTVSTPPDPPPAPIPPTVEGTPEAPPVASNAPVEGLEVPFKSAPTLPIDETDGERDTEHVLPSSPAPPIQQVAPGSSPATPAASPRPKFDPKRI